MEPLRALLVSVTLCASVLPSVAKGQHKSVSGADEASSVLTDYYQALTERGFVNADTASIDTLKGELHAAESSLRNGASGPAAVALYAIVESPRYTDYQDFVEFQNAEYYLGVALLRSGAYESALRYLQRAVDRGPASMYFAPAHRRIVDIALDTQQYSQILRQLTSRNINEPLPPGILGERSYLRARAAYAEKKLDEAEGHLVQISPKSRLYSSALYLRGVIRSRRGDFTGAGDAFCEIVDTPDKDRFTFVVDDRYFTIKDLARLGLGRIAHEAQNYDDAYYHYFQIPEDSVRLSEALFEASWSMYQKREISTARDLVVEFRKDFADSPLAPEAQLLAGYIELADCEFDAAQKHYDSLIAKLAPLISRLERLRERPDEIRALYDGAVKRWRRTKTEQRQPQKAKTDTDRIVALLQIDPQYVRLHEAIAGLRKEAADSAHVVRSWRALIERTATNAVQTTPDSISTEGDDDDPAALIGDIDALQKKLAWSRRQLRTARRSETLPDADFRSEQDRLKLLERELEHLRELSVQAGHTIASDVSNARPADLQSRIEADFKHAQNLSAEASKLLATLETKSREEAHASLSRLYLTMRHALDKAKLGKIDAVIGQKRRLQIEVQDLAAGRFPAELHGQLWEQGLIGDDEEYWPFEGEFWADEYEGWR